MAVLKIRDENGNVHEIVALRGEQGENGEKGDSGAPEIRYPDSGDDTYIYDSMDGGYCWYIQMKANTEYRSRDKIIDFGIQHFRPAEDNFSPMWSVMFETGNVISAFFPVSVVWSVAEPVFEPNRTYWLSFVECGDKYLGVWSVV